ncbi:hypothetical protein Lser_V15G18904 [Lactuca serriola]
MSRYTYCPVCNESQWVDENTKGKKVAHKVLRYFPVTPRLQCLYCSRHTAKDMIWHSTGRSKDGTMLHPVDGTSWKKFDMKYPDFSREPRTVRLRLVVDYFNRFGNMCNPHSTRPIILTTYNLPPWLCMKESSFMLTLLILGPKAPRKDLDVFLRPLVDELKQLWSFGVRTKDAATYTFFNMKAITNHPMAPTYWASLNNLICARYRGCKNIVKDRLIDFVGDVEAPRAQAPTGMDRQRWNATIDHFLIEKHQKRSAGNKECQKKQVVKNRGGTCIYGSACFKKEFVDPLVEDQYNTLVAEVALQTHHIVKSGGDSDTIDWIAIFEKVLGT